MEHKTVSRSLFRVNKYQRSILTLILSLAVVMIAMMTVCILFLYFDLAGDIFNPERVIGGIKTTIIFSLMFLPVILLAGIFWAFYLSNRIIGPFERIISELDKVITTRKKEHIHAREGDDLAKEVLERINTLIDKMS